MRTPLMAPGLPGTYTPDSQFGFLVRVYDKHPWMPKGAFGWNGLYGTQTWVDPKNKICAVYMKITMMEALTRVASGSLGDETAPESNFERAVYHSLSA